MRLAGLLSASLAAWFCSPAPARAAEGTAATLEVSRAADATGCIASAELVKNVESRLRRAVFARSGSAPLALAVELGRRERSWVAKIRIADAVGPLGERELSSEARHCSALDDSLSLVVALLVDTPPARPMAASAAPGASESAASAAPKPVAPAAATPLVLPPETHGPRETVRFGARATGALALGLLPGAASGVDLAVAARFPSGLRLRALGDFYFERTESLGDATSGAELGVLRAGVEACGLSFGPRRLTFELCLGQLLGRQSVSGFGFDRNDESARLLVSVSAGADARLPLTEDFGLVVAARAEVPLARDRFTAHRSDGTTAVIFQPAPLFVVTKVGLEVAP